MFSDSVISHEQTAGALVLRKHLLFCSPFDIQVLDILLDEYCWFFLMLEIFGCSLVFY